MPPAFSQSAFVMYCEKSLDGLAEGEPAELPDPLGVEVAPLPDEVPDPLPDVPEGVLEPELPAAPLPLLPVWAAAIPGASAMIPTKSKSISFCIAIPSWCRRSAGSVQRVYSKIGASHPPLA